MLETAMDREQERRYKNAAIYAIDVSSFRDANGVGIGLPCFAGVSDGMGKELITLHNLSSNKIS